MSKLCMYPFARRFLEQVVRGLEKDPDANPTIAASWVFGSAPDVSATPSPSAELTDMTQGEAVALLLQSGFYLSEGETIFADAGLSKHTGIQLRQSGDHRLCSLHISVEPGGQNGGKSTVRSHYDAINPFPDDAGSHPAAMLAHFGEDVIDSLIHAALGDKLPCHQ